MAKDIERKEDITDEEEEVIKTGSGTEAGSASGEKAETGKTEAAFKDGDPDKSDDKAQSTAESDTDETKGDAQSAKKKKRGDKKTEALQAKVEELEDRVKRQMAEFDNFRKRTEKEKGAMFETGARSVIEKILPVVDNFERGLASVPEDEAGSPFAEGMNMIYKQLTDELDKMEVKPIEAVGCEFDPELHNAVMQVESDEYESGVVAQELQKGYTYRGTVVRHSMVAVVQ